MHCFSQNYTSRSQVFAASTWNFCHKVELDLVIPIVLYALGFYLLGYYRMLYSLVNAVLYMYVNIKDNNIIYILLYYYIILLYIYNYI